LGRVLVTGGAGFIGSELVRQLQSGAAEIVVVDNLVNGTRKNLADLVEQGVTLEIADIRDASRMDDLIKGCDTVFHLACMGVRHSLHSPLENHDVNASATLALVDAARRASVGRFVYVSTSEVYGSALRTPMAEDHPTLPTTVYGAAKLAGECYVRAMFKSYDFPVTIVRPFNAFGPRSHHEGDSGEVIPKMMLRSMAGLPLIIFGDGQQTRDFSYVADTASAILAAGALEAAIGETINVGSGVETSMNELAELINGVTGRNDPVIEYQTDRPGDLSRLCCDASAAKRILGYEPRTNVHDGLIKLHDWYSARGRDPADMLQGELVRNWEIDG
jgi:UDP-glucose 4-epimerase